VRAASFFARRQNVSNWGFGCPVFFFVFLVASFAAIFWYGFVSNKAEVIEFYFGGV
jgi:hypothetical protein